MLRSTLLSLLLLLGCSKEPHSNSPLDNWMAPNGKVKILSTTAIIDDLVQQIGGEHVDHISLVTGEIDPHSYELVKGDDEKLSYAQVLFYNGLGLEHGASLHYRLENHPSAVSLGGAISEAKPEAIIKVDGQTDPHIWMDLSLWEGAIDPIVSTLSSLDPAHEAVFKENGEKTRQKMREMDEKIQNLMLGVPAEKRFLVTSHDAFNYFSKRYLAGEDGNWGSRFAAPEGLSPDSQLSSAHIFQLIDHLSQYKIHVVFPESNVNRDSLKKIVQACRDKGLDVRISQEVLYGDALGGKETDANTHLGMMEHNAQALIKEWQ